MESTDFNTKKLYRGITITINILDDSWSWWFELRGKDYGMTCRPPSSKPFTPSTFEPMAMARAREVIDNLLEKDNFSKKK